MMLGVGETILVALISLCLVGAPLATLVIAIMVYLKLQKIEAAVERLEHPEVHANPQG